jgi:hypothetical protein
MARRLNNMQPERQTTDDPMAVEFLQKLERLGMGKYLPDDEQELEPTRSERWREYVEWTKTYEAEREAKRQAEEDEQNAPKTPATMLAAVLSRESGNRSVLPLNGAGVLHAVLKGVGGHGTVNGASA